MRYWLILLLIITVPAVFAQENIVVPITASLETAPARSREDSVDDPAIWLHPIDPTQSLIIATDKTRGLVVFDLSGAEIQVVRLGEVNNVDLRYNFPLDGNKVALVVASNRSERALSIFTINPETRTLEPANGQPIAAELTAYGLCMYVSPLTGRYYVFVSGVGTGDVHQFELRDDGTGQVEAELVRRLNIGSQVEGCVADDEQGWLFIGEETEGIWRYSAEPDADASRLQIDTTEADGHLIPDVEGLALYYGQPGYLIASSQGSSEFILYERAEPHAYLGTFALEDSSQIDEVTGTDGIDVTNFPLNSDFAQGMFIAQDNRNTMPDDSQNFKLVGWEVIATALNLQVDTTFDPRLVGWTEDVAVVPALVEVTAEPADITPAATEEEQDGEMGLTPLGGD